jgi:protocatechuate 3,4-dioxygenase beta subunit
MRMIYWFRLSMLLTAISLSSCGQSSSEKPGIAASSHKSDLPVGGPCDRCELFYQGMPVPEMINWNTSIADPMEPGERMEIVGKLFQADGKTPAKNVVLYFYHTNAAGYYAPSDTQTLGKANGHLRGWVKTDADGRFQFSSVRPAPYPGRDIPAHIHFLVKEPGKTVYYIDEVWFDDDPLITPEKRSKAEKRGGDMIIHLTKLDDIAWKGSMQIILGRNIPGYKAGK